MARHAIDRNLVLHMAANAVAHVQVHRTHRDGLLGHVAMARRAIDSRANMRRVIEFHVRRLLKLVDALPRNVLSLGLVGGDLFDFGMVCIDRDVTRHADGHAGDCRIGSLVDPCVAEGAREQVGTSDMNFVGKSDGLHR